MSYVNKNLRAKAKRPPGPWRPLIPYRRACAVHKNARDEVIKEAHRLVVLTECSCPSWHKTKGTHDPRCLQARLTTLRVLIKAVEDAHAKMDVEWAAYLKTQPVLKYSRKQSRRHFPTGRVEEPPTP